MRTTASGARLVVCLAVVVATSIALAGRPSPARAVTPVAFRASAAAEGVRTGVNAEGGPVTNQLADGASPIAQAAIDSTAGSTALGSVAYPGDLVITAPGLVAGFSGGQTSGAIPPYPLIAAAGSTTSPESSAEAPGSSMRAVAGQRHAEGVATSGAGDDGADGAGSRLAAFAEVAAADDDVVTATAASEISSVMIGPLVLGHVAARSHVTRAPGSEVTREASFEATGITVAGTDVRLTSDGLVVAGTTTPVDASPIQAILDGAGITVRSIDQEETDDGIVAAGLLVTRIQDLPTAITPATVTYTFGRTVARVSAVSLPGPATGGSGPSTAGAAPPPEPIQPSGPAPAAPAAPRPVPAAPAAEAPTPPTATPAQPASQTGAAPLFDLTTFYLVLVLAAACAGAVLELLRHLGVRLQWT